MAEMKRIALALAEQRRTPQEEEPHRPVTPWPYPEQTQEDVDDFEARYLARWERAAYEGGR